MCFYLVDLVKSISPYILDVCDKFSVLVVLGVLIFRITDYINTRMCAVYASRS